MDEGQLHATDMKHITAVTPDYIELDLLLLEKVPEFPSADLIEAAQAIIDTFRVELLAHEFGVPAGWDYVKNGLFQNEEVKEHFGPQWLCHFLASALGCGLDWICNFASVPQEQIKVEEWWSGELPRPDPKYEEVALGILRYFDKERQQEESSPRVEAITQFIACMLDFRIQTLLPSTRRIRTGAGDHLALTNLTRASVWYAVPVPLANTLFSSKRVWLLEPYDPDQPFVESPRYREEFGMDSGPVDPRKIEEHKLEPVRPNGFLGFNPRLGESPATVVLQRTGETFDTADLRASRNAINSWRLIAKSRLVGCPAIVESKGVVQLLKKQRVYG